MERELFWLTLTTLMTGSIWVIYILNRFLEIGVLGAMKNEGSAVAVKAPWAARAARAHQNAVENLVVFATLVLIAHTQGSANMVATAAAIYFFARLVHFLAYTAGIPGVRTVAFLVGFGCQMAIGLSILGAL